VLSYPSWIVCDVPFFANWMSWTWVFVFNQNGYLMWSHGSDNDLNSFCSYSGNRERTDSPGHTARKLTFQSTTPPDFRNSAPPAAPRDPCPSPDNTRLPDIIYVYILSRCLRSRHHSLFVCFFFVFWCFLVCCCILYSTSLSSYVQPDDGHHYGRNM